MLAPKLNLSNLNLSYIDTAVEYSCSVAQGYAYSKMEDADSIKCINRLTHIVENLGAQFYLLDLCKNFDKVNNFIKSCKVKDSDERRTKVISILIENPLETPVETPVITIEELTAQLAKAKEDLSHYEELTSQLVKAKDNLTHCEESRKNLLENSKIFTEAFNNFKYEAEVFAAALNQE
jgi:hypothetical protein